VSATLSMLWPWRRRSVGVNLSLSGLARLDLWLWRNGLSRTGLSLPHLSRRALWLSLASAAGLGVITTAACVSMAPSRPMAFRTASPPMPAQTIAELMRATNYDLTAVREGVPVKPVVVDRIAVDLNEIQDPERRKRLFLRILLPIVLRENAQIARDRADILVGKGDDLYAKYNVKPGHRAALLRRVDTVPPALVLAQAAIESGWGTSRFLREANNLFGHRTYKKEVAGLTPAGGDGTFKVTRYKTLAGSVRSYIHNLNTHSAYATFRKDREAARSTGRELSAHELSAGLVSYSELGADYVARVRTVIAANRLNDFDRAQLASR
jgi:Bax protein